MVNMTRSSLCSPLIELRRHNTKLRAHRKSDRRPSTSPEGSEGSEAPIMPHKTHNNTGNSYNRDCDDRWHYSSYFQLSFSLIGAILVGSVTYSTIRKSATVALPFSGLSLREIGTIASHFSIGYGVSKFAGGILSDLMSPLVLFTGGLFVGSLINISVAFLDSTRAYSLAWLASGVLQGVGGPSMSKLIYTAAPNRSGLLWSLAAFTGNIGYMVTPFFLIDLARANWKLPLMYTGIAGVVVALVAFAINFPFYHNRNIAHSSNGSGEKSASNNQTSEHNLESKSTVSIGSILTGWRLALLEISPNIRAALIQRDILCYALANFLVVFCLKGMADWTGMYLIESQRVSPAKSAELMLWSEIGGLVGCFFCGLIADQMMSYGGKAFSCLLFAVICAVALFGLSLCESSTSNMNLSYNATIARSVSACTHLDAPHSCDAPEDIGHILYLSHTPSTTPLTVVAVSASTWLFQVMHSFYQRTVHLHWGQLQGHLHRQQQAGFMTQRLLLFLAGVGINGPKTLLQVAIQEKVPKSISGTICGLAGFVGQLGASVAGYGVGWAIEMWGWQALLPLLSSSCVCCAFLLGIALGSSNSTSSAVIG